MNVSGPTRNLIDKLATASSVAELNQFTRQMPQQVQTLHQSGTPAYDTAMALSEIGEQVAVRLIALAEQRLGPPPVPYAFMVTGSLARREQILGSDQDNALILGNDYREEAHGDYFQALGNEVCKGLAACGYALCPGNIMASNPRWRLSLARWQGRFRQWIEEPEPKALLRCCIFFDLRAIHGDKQLVHALRQDFLARTRDNRLFLAYLAAAARHFRPALGLFGRLRFKSDDQGAKRMNLKKHGITPIVDLTRTWSLAEGLDAVATRDRLAALAEQNRIDRESTERLQRAFDAIAELRIAHQLRRLNAGEPPDYLLLRDELSAEDERRLKRAYRHINDAQHALNRHFRAQDFT